MEIFVIIVVGIIFFIIVKNADFSTSHYEESELETDNKHHKTYRPSKLDFLADDIIEQIEESEKDAIEGNWSKNEIPGSSGEFGLTESNPVPLAGPTVAYGWLPLLRYPFTSKSGFTVYFPVSTERFGSTGTVFGGFTDIYHTFDINGSPLESIYVNGYQNFSSQKAPKGFFLLSDIDSSQDAEKVLNKFKNLSEKEKQNLNKEIFAKLNGK